MKIGFSQFEINNIFSDFNKVRNTEYGIRIEKVRNIKVRNILLFYLHIKVRNTFYGIISFYSKYFDITTQWFHEIKYHIVW